MSIGFVVYSEQRSIEDRMFLEIDSFLKKRMRNFFVFRGRDEIFKEKKNKPSEFDDFDYFFFLIDSSTSFDFDLLDSLDPTRFKISFFISEKTRFSFFLTQSFKKWKSYFLTYPIRDSDFLNFLNFFYSPPSSFIPYLLDYNEEDQKEKEEELEPEKEFSEDSFTGRFKDLKTMKVQSQYFCGISGGADFFDVAESHSGSLVAVFLAHASNYKVSSLFSSSFRDSISEMNLNEVFKKEAIKKIIFEILKKISSLFKEKDQISLSYGIWSRDQRMLRLIQFGNSMIFYSSDLLSPFIRIPSQKIISEKLNPFHLDLMNNIQEIEIHFGLESRLVLLSDGCIQCLGGEERVKQLLAQFQGKKSVLLMQKLTLILKSHFSEGEEFLPVDSALIVIQPHFRLSAVQRSF